MFIKKEEWNKLVAKIDGLHTRLGSFERAVVDGVRVQKELVGVLKSLDELLTHFAKDLDAVRRGQIQSVERTERLESSSNQAAQTVVDLTTIASSIQFTQKQLSNLHTDLVKVMRSASSARPMTTLRKK